MESDTKREPVLEDTLVNLERIVATLASLSQRIEDVTYILDTDVSSNGVLRKCEVAKDAVAPRKNIRFDCAKLSKIGLELSETCSRAIELLKHKITIPK
ncbi:hypothetical protein MUO79_10220 [Candidatus Bathyarchaeota archaeon]|nr:hypothetical protein [Candidatus Bathyarchaeota archaeon]